MRSDAAKFREAIKARSTREDLENALAMLPFQRMGVVRQDIDVTQWERTMKEAIFAVLFEHQGTQTRDVTR